LHEAPFLTGLDITTDIENNDRCDR